MAAPKGNQFWRLRSRHGNTPVFDNPDKLWESACDYFEAVESNPLRAAELVKYQGEAKVKFVPKMRPMTIDGLCNFCGISNETWFQYAKKEQFLDVVKRVERIMRDQKFAGAAAELLNSSIIARDLGLVDKQSIQAGEVVWKVIYEDKNPLPDEESA